MKVQPHANLFQLVEKQMRYQKAFRMPALLWCFIVVGMINALLTAFLQSSWIILPLIFVGAVGSCCYLLLTWRPNADEARNVRNKAQEVVQALVYFLVSSGVILVVCFIVIQLTMTLPTSLCVCANGKQLATWFDGIVANLGFTFIVTVALGATFISGDWLITAIRQLRRSS